ncbi:hypothetical protein Lalb_Chr20g0114341 [Lupinus albus]|uniref:Uncharacterized protein n=1 Tax=Lupinus albus TaxID=3870 RepID=A0A6A4NWL3_LUPAL|nr:hypothetical protein Lalb_Chr20g0114341 [Lupinus albus]
MPIFFILYIYFLFMCILLLNTNGLYHFLIFFSELFSSFFFSSSFLVIECSPYL